MLQQDGENEINSIESHRKNNELGRTQRNLSTRWGWPDTTLDGLRLALAETLVEVVPCYVFMCYVSRPPGLPTWVYPPGLTHLVWKTTWVDHLV